MSKLVSSCCSASFLHIRHTDNIQCEACLRECDIVEACETCGEILNDGECQVCDDPETPDQQRILNAEYEEAADHGWYDDFI